MSTDTINLADHFRLALLPIEFCLRAYQATTLPDFLGSTLRGALGMGLKRTLCLLDEESCDSHCELPAQCIYSFIFETNVARHFEEGSKQADLPHPYIVSPPPCNNSVKDRRKYDINDELRFKLTLLGPAIDYYEEIIRAIESMAYYGLGAERAKFQLTEVNINGENIIDDLGDIVIPVASYHLNHLIEQRLNIIISEVNEEIKLALLTQMRIQIAGKLQSKIKFEALINSLINRLDLLTTYYGQQIKRIDTAPLIAEAKQVVIAEDRRIWFDPARYSNRQATKLKIGGELGSVTFSGANIRKFLPILIAGEILQIGKASSLGLGRYQLIIHSVNSSLDEP